MDNFLFVVFIKSCTQTMDLILDIGIFLMCLGIFSLGLAFLIIAVETVGDDDDESL